ncbi:DMT family transporter [Pseudodesulfovibrio sp.]|nr:DMT family transporter [Pseudodesulfovibrio sp.]
MIQGLIYAIISATAFGAMAILVKLGYNAGMTGGEMMQFRFLYAVLILLVIMFIKDRSLLKISRAGLGKCAFLGLVIYWLQTTCFVTALATIPASTAALVLYVHPVTVALLSAIFLKMKIDRFVMLTLILVMGGCCLVFYDAFLKEVDGSGLAYAIGAMTFFSCYLVLIQVLLKDLKPLTATLYVMLFAGIAFSITGDPSAWLNQRWETFTIGLSLGVFPGVIAVTFLYLSIEKVGSAYACIFSSIEPIITLLAAALFLGESVDILQIGGAALIILGIVIPNGRAIMLKRRFE